MSKLFCEQIIKKIDLKDLNILKHINKWAGIVADNQRFSHTNSLHLCRNISRTESLMNYNISYNYVSYKENLLEYMTMR